MGITAAAALYLPCERKYVRRAGRGKREKGKGKREKKS